MRVALAAVLFSRPDVLLLDEPTNYLDLEGAIWLESFLARYPHTVLVISHDRDLLNRSVGAILHLDRKKLTLYQGPYDTFEDTRRARLEQLGCREEEAGRRPRAYAVLRRPLPRQGLQGAPGPEPHQGAGAHEADRRHRRGPGRRASTSPRPRSSRPPIIRLEDVSVGYDGRPMLRGLDLRIDQDDRIALLGENGQGKSTLAKLLSDRLQPMAGRKVASLEAPRRLLRPAPGRRARARRDPAPAPPAPPPRRDPGEAPRPPRRRRHRRRHRHHRDRPALRRPEVAPARSCSPPSTRRTSSSSTSPPTTSTSRAATRWSRRLTEYGGAVILVSHDPHLVELVAERLWLVKDGRVAALRRRHGRLPPAAPLRAQRHAAPRRAPTSRKPRPAPRGETRPAPRRGRALRGPGRQARGDARGHRRPPRQPAALLPRRYRRDRHACRRSAPRSRTAVARAERLWADGAGSGSTPPRERAR